MLRSASILVFVAALALAAPPTPDQLVPLQLSIMSAHAASTATAAPASATMRPPRPKRDVLPDAHAHDNILRKKAHSGFVKKRRGVDAVKRHFVERASGFARRDDYDALEDTSSDTLKARDELEQRAAEQYPLMSNSSASQPANSWAASATPNPTASAPLVNSAVTAPATLQSPVPTAPVEPTGYFAGVSSYYLFALNDNDRYAVLDAVSGAGLSVVRIFIAGVGANNKGSSNDAVPDLEPNQVGQYDDTILYKIDQLMYDCKQRGLKLLIAMSDRYALGFWSTDAYAIAAGIVSAASSGVQKVSDASKFYTDSTMVQSIDKRINHILNHQNQLLGGKRWAELDDVIYALEAQNEPMGHMSLASSTWVCERSQYIKSLLPSDSSILVSTGGGITIDTSLQPWATNCPYVDVVSVHDYGTNADTAVNALQNAASGSAKGKIVMMGEWGISGSNKAATVQSFVQKFKAAGIPWMYWQVTRPGQGAKDFEVWTDEPAWKALSGSNNYFPPSAAPTSQSSTSSSSSSSSAWSASSSKSAWSSSSSSSSAWSSSSQAWSSSSPSPTSSSSSWSTSPSSSKTEAKAAKPAPSSGDSASQPTSSASSSSDGSSAGSDGSSTNGQ